MDEMLKELQDPEEQKIMDKIKELMDKLDKKESMQQLEKMSQQTEQKNKNLDRLMELMKQLELENKVEDTADKLDELAKATGRSKAFIAIEAIEKYCELEAWQISAIQQGIRDVDEGKIVLLT